jgi:uncharacterized protein (DUF1330 family)
MSSHKAKSRIAGCSINMWQRLFPTIEAHEGRVVAFDEEPEVVEGQIEHPRTVILEFPSMTAFHAWYDSPEYQEILTDQRENYKRF